MRILLLAITTLFLFGCASPADDLNAICDEATKLNNGQGEYATGSLAEKVTKMAETIDSRIESTPIRNAWEAVAAASPEQRHALMQQAGKEVGVQNWQCPALIKLYKQTE